MSRIDLGGVGYPIPLEAMPDPSTDMHPVVLSLQTGHFRVADYIALGFTNFEVWCIGGAGGEGGDFRGLRDSRLYEPWFTHMITLAPDDARFVANMSGIRPGAGGGGGLHHISGLLVDLPDVVEVVAGVAGAQGDPGFDGIWNSDAQAYASLRPGSGHDGGASTFHDTLCRASGGKGGEAPRLTELPNPFFGYNQYGPGAGGTGGAGNRTTAGGGAAGADPYTAFVAPTQQNPYGSHAMATRDGVEGTWDGDVGQGGGGGHGGSWSFDTGPLVGV